MLLITVLIDWGLRLQVSHILCIYRRNRQHVNIIWCLICVQRMRNYIPCVSSYFIRLYPRSPAPRHQFLFWRSHSTKFFLRPHSSPSFLPQTHIICAHAHTHVHTYCLFLTYRLCTLSFIYHRSTFLLYCNHSHSHQQTHHTSHFHPHLVFQKS